MIKSTELMIGNWVYEDGKPERVIMVDGEVDVIQCENGINTPLSDFEPIPLTEQILLKAGFVLNVEGNSVYSLNKKIYGIFKTEYNKDGSVSDTYFEIYNEGCPLLKIRTLHHLQNYVHAITQAELTINL